MKPKVRKRKKVVRDPPCQHVNLAQSPVKKHILVCTACGAEKARIKPSSKAPEQVPSQDSPIRSMTKQDLIERLIDYTPLTREWLENLTRNDLQHLAMEWEVEELPT